MDDQLTDIKELKTAAREINISESNIAEDVELCKIPYVGNTTAGGAYERRTPWISVIPLLRGGGWGTTRWWFGKEGCHGSKRIIGTSLLQPLFEPTESFPDTVLFQIMRINDMVILPLPFEITSESGRRISERVKKEFLDAGQSIKYSYVASVANGYFGYSTTPEEYEYQSYEGGSTLYGKYSTPYITAQLGVLAKDMQSEVSIEVLRPEWKYILKTTSLMPEKSLAEGTRKELIKPAFEKAEETYQEDYFAFNWLDVGPYQINLHQPLAEVEVKKGEQWVPLVLGLHPITDDGYDVEVRLIDDADNGMAEYQVRWYNPEKGGVYRFRIAPREGQELLVSSPFEY